MKILITNDDGINAIGINVLAKTFCRDNAVIMVAPQSERSACSHSLSIHHDISYRKQEGYSFPAYAISGTPADCVKLGVLHLLKQKPDLVLSGINNGSNLGSDIMYSGTVSAAFEAAYLGIPAIAVSLSKWNCEPCEYERAAAFLLEALPRLRSAKLPAHTVLNVNYPAFVPCKGVKFTKVGLNLYDDVFVESENGGSVRLQGAPIEHTKNEADCDVEWCRKGYVTISPVQIDRNDYTTLETLKGTIQL